MDSIKVYETKQEYLNDIENLPVPSIQYVKETDESFKKSTKQVQVMRAWMDDFDEGWDGDYVFQDFITDPEYCGSNPYIYTGNIWEYGDNVYYLWERENDSQSSTVAYLLTTTIDFNLLKTRSLKYNFDLTGVQNVNIIFNEFAGFLDEDSEYYSEKGPSQFDYERLVKVEWITIDTIVNEKIGE